MAPPSTRRPGFSRRAQYGLFLGYVIAVGGVLFAGLLLVIAIVDPTGFNALKGAALDVTSPIASGGRSVVGFFAGIGDSVGNYVQAGSQNAELKRRLAAARRKLIEAQATELENKRLKALLRLTGETERSGRGDPDRRLLLRLASAGSPPSPPEASAGVEPGQPVRSRRRADRPGDRDRALGEPGPARHRQRQQRSGAAGPRRHSGDRRRPWRRDDRPQDPGGRPESVPPRRHVGDVGRRRRLSARHSGRGGGVGPRATGRWRSRSPTRPSRICDGAAGLPAAAPTCRSPRRPRAP